MVFVHFAIAIASAGAEPCEYPVTRISDWDVPSDEAIFMVVNWRHRDDLVATSDGVSLPVTTYCDGRCLAVIDSTGLPEGATVLLSSPALDQDDVGEGHVTEVAPGLFEMEFNVSAPSGLTPSMAPPKWERNRLHVDEEVCRAKSSNVLDVDTRVPSDVVGLVVRTEIEGGGRYLSFQQGPYDEDFTLGLEGDPETCHRAQVIAWDGTLGDLSDSVCDKPEPLWTCSTAGTPSGVGWGLALLLALRRRGRT